MNPVNTSWRSSGATLLLVVSDCHKLVRPRASNWQMNPLEFRRLKGCSNTQYKIKKLLKLPIKNLSTSGSLFW